MELLLIFSTLVCLSLSVKFSLSQTVDPDSVQQTPEPRRIIQEVNQLYALAIATINKDSADIEHINGVQLMQQLIDSNATGVLEGYTSCPRDISANGIYTMKIWGAEPFPVLCDAKTADPGWTVIAKRTNSNLSFYQNWQTYKQGFGSLSDDFFIGLDKLHLITQSQPHELYIYLEDFEGQTRYAKYDEFLIENENAFYAMSKLGHFTGDAGDSLAYSKNNKFTTYDKDNDASSHNCAIKHSSPWWHKSCTNSALFGLYLRGKHENILQSSGIYWYYWRGPHYSYKTMKMMVRPKYSRPH